MIGEFINHSKIAKHLERSLLNSRVPYGSKKDAGQRFSVETWGKGRGVSRVQRKKGNSFAAQSPNNVKGRRAFPPLTAKVLVKKLNKKDKRKVLIESLKSLLNFKNLHFNPLIKESVKEVRVKDLENFLKLNLESSFREIKTKSKEVKIRAGKGKSRNRKYKTVRVFNLIYKKEDKELAHRLNNYPGLNLINLDSLNLKHIYSVNNYSKKINLFLKDSKTKLNELINKN